MTSSSSATRRERRTETNIICITFYNWCTVKILNYWFWTTCILWSVKGFRSYVYGVPFKLASDHKEIATALKGKTSNDTFTCKLTRWVDRLIPFNFDVDMSTPGKTLGKADPLSRNPTSLSRRSTKVTHYGTSGSRLKLFQKWRTTCWRLGKQSTATGKQSKSTTTQRNAEVRKEFATPRHP